MSRCRLKLREDGQMIVWVDPPLGVAFPAGEIHLWGEALAQTDEVAQRLVRVLSEDEQRRADGFHFERVSVARLAWAAAVPEY